MRDPPPPRSRCECRLPTARCQHREELAKQSAFEQRLQIAPTIENKLDSIGHIQIADTPGRHEPGSGEINYPFLLAFLDQIGYSGWVGCEYVPRAETGPGLAWAQPYLVRGGAS